jgi:hypothetical protein
MDPAIIVLICTSLANLIATLKNSRCSEIEGHCCHGLCDIMLKREVLDDEGDPVHSQIEGVV